MPTTKLTQTVIDGLNWSSAVRKWYGGKTAANRRIEVWDSQLPGFGLRLRDSGLKTWQALFRVNGKAIRETFGTVGQIPNVGEARERARLSMTGAKGGINPVDQKRAAEAEQKRQAEAQAARTANTLAAVITRYLAERPKVNSRGRPLAPEYLAEIGRVLERDVAASKLGKIPITEVDGKQHIRPLLREMARQRPGHARHVHSYLSTALAWAVDEDLIAKSPCAGIKSPAPKVERERALEDWEISLFWQACGRIGWPFGPLFQLLLLLGARRDELAESTWPQFDLKKQTWTLRGRDTKNDEALITHLPKLAIEIIEQLPTIARRNGFVFTTTGERPISGFGRAAERVEAMMRKAAAEEGLPQIEHFTRHDLRRSLETGMAKLRILPHVADLVLNHKGGTTITGVAKIYNRYRYLDERREALDLWAQHIEKLVGLQRDEMPPGRPSNVVELTRHG